MKSRFSNSLTYLLPLYGRPHLTTRWLRHASQNSLTSPVYIADGKPSDSPFATSNYLQNFPNLHLNYVEYQDNTPNDYFCKLFHALSAIRTPYVVLCDNDDFPFFQGLQECVEFLDTHPSFVAAGGQVAGLHGPSSPAASILGPLAHSFPLFSKYYINNYWYHCHDICSDVPFERVKSQIHRPLSVYYYVHKTDILRTCYEFLSSLAEPMFVSETVINCYVALSGKIRSDPDNLILVREVGTSLASGDIGHIKSFLGRPSTHSTFTSVGSFLSNFFEALGQNAQAKEIFEELASFHYSELISRLRYSLKWKSPVRRHIKTTTVPVLIAWKTLFSSILYLAYLRIQSFASPSPSVRRSSAVCLNFFRSISSYY